jgi:transposase
VQQSWSHDQESGAARVGPHRAEISIWLDGLGVKDRISRGQQKLLAATLSDGSRGDPSRGRSGAALSTQRQKGALNKSILDQGWFEFRRQLEYEQRNGENSP